MRFLVTGGAGFIGSHLCERLVEAGHGVVCLDNFDAYYDPKIKERNLEGLSRNSSFRLVRGDILDWSLLENVFEDRYDAVVHLAARAGVRPSIENPRLYQKVNVEGTVNLLEWSAKKEIPKFIMASSSSVYGNNVKVPFSEDDPVDFPISPYAATKKAVELLGYTYHSLFSMSVTCLRFFTVYGPRQRPDMAIARFVRSISEGKEITVYGDGTTRRDYTYITDILDGLIKYVERCKGYRVYNLGESRTTELNRLVDLLEKAMGKKAKIIRKPLQPGDVQTTFADISRAKKELDYAPHVPVEQGLGRYVEWFGGR
jgi:UDP-glucuronate 4-epimerase